MSLAYQEQTWAVRAACAGADPDSLFVRGAAQRQARNVCFLPGSLGVFGGCVGFECCVWCVGWFD